MAHGVNDAMLLVEQARSFVAALRAVSTASVVSVELPFAQHAFDMVASPRTRATVEAVERFLEVTYGEHLGGSPQPRSTVIPTSSPETMTTAAMTTAAMTTAATTAAAMTTAATTTTKDV